MDTPYDPAIYDLMTPTTCNGDVGWYRDLAVQARGPVLELAAGTGRIALELARAGVSVCALDCDAAMLEQLSKKAEMLPDGARERLEAVNGDMREFELNRLFSLIICPLRSFLHNLGTAEQQRCLSCVLGHLEPGAEFAFDISHPARDVARLRGDAALWRWVDERELPGGERLMRSECVRYDDVRKVTHSRARFEHFDVVGNLLHTYVRALELSYLEPEDVERLLLSAGFERVRIFGAFDGRPLTAEAEVQVIRAGRPAP